MLLKKLTQEEHEIIKEFPLTLESAEYLKNTENLSFDENTEINEDMQYALEHARKSLIQGNADSLYQSLKFIDTQEPRLLEDIDKQIQENIIDEFIGDKVLGYSDFDKLDKKVSRENYAKIISPNLLGNTTQDLSLDINKATITSREDRDRIKDICSFSYHDVIQKIDVMSAYTDYHIGIQIASQKFILYIEDNTQERIDLIYLDMRDISGNNAACYIIDQLKPKDRTTEEVLGIESDIDRKSLKWNFLATSQEKTQITNYAEMQDIFKNIYLRRRLDKKVCTELLKKRQMKDRIKIQQQEKGIAGTSYAISNIAQNESIDTVDRLHFINEYDNLVICLGEVYLGTIPYNKSNNNFFVNKLIDTFDIKMKKLEEHGFVHINS